MTVPPVTPAQVRTALLLRDEIALLDVRHEAAFATGHPLFAANMAAGRIALEAEVRLPRKDVPIVLYDAGEGLVSMAAERLAALGYGNVRQLDGGLQGWRAAGYELFQDVNSYAKAFGELVEHRRHTPSLPAEEVAALISSQANIRDSRRPTVRRICHHEHSGFDQRARRRTGAARRPRRAKSRNHHHRQLRRAHPIDHRHPVADQRRRRQPRGGAAQRDHRLDAGPASARSRLGQARRDRRLGGQRKPRRATSPIAPVSAISARKK